MNDTILFMNKICKSFSNKKNVLYNLNFEACRNDFIAIKGNSGCGKSTLLNIIGLLDIFDIGNFKILNKDINSKNYNNLNAFRSKNIGFVFQSYQLIESLSVEENILLPMIYSDKKIVKHDIILLNELLDEFNLEKLKYKKTKFLSGGEKQRVAIARALIRQPELIIADEPTGNLDEYNANIIINYLKQYSEKEKCVIMVTHNKEVFNKGHKRYLLNEGELHQC